MSGSAIIEGEEAFSVVAFQYSECVTTFCRLHRIKVLLKIILRSNYKFYSQELLNNLFKHPYTKIGFVIDDLGVSRLTAANYLNTLADDGILRKEKVGNSNYYINVRLFDLLKKK